MNEDLFRNNFEVDRYCSQVSLTSLSFLSSGDPKLHKFAFESVSSLDEENYGSIFAETAVYSKMMLLHKHFTESIYSRPKQQIANVSIEEFNTTAAVQLYNSRKDNSVATLPFSGWIVQALIEWNKDGSQMSIDRVYTHPLERKEIERTLDGQDCDHDQTAVEVYLHETLLTPKSKFSFDLNDFPSTLIIPATGGIAMSVFCHKNGSEDESLNFAYTCVPKKYTVGQLTCASVVANDTSSEVRSQVRVERSVGDAKPDYWEKIRAEMGQLWDTWKVLVPDIFSCTASVAGCDMCFYFLGTYNYSVVPAACLGGCTINTVDSCTSVVTNSLLNTVKKITGDKD